MIRLGSGDTLKTFNPRAISPLLRWATSYRFKYRIAANRKGRSCHFLLPISHFHSVGGACMLMSGMLSCNAALRMRNNGSMKLRMPFWLIGWVGYRLLGYSIWFWGNAAWLSINLGVSQLFISSPKGLEYKRLTQTVPGCHIRLIGMSYIIVNALVDWWFKYIFVVNYNGSRHLLCDDSKLLSTLPNSDWGLLVWIGINRLMNSMKNWLKNLVSFCTQRVIVMQRLGLIELV